MLQRICDKHKNEQCTTTSYIFIFRYSWHIGDMKTHHVYDPKSTVQTEDPDVWKKNVPTIGIMKHSDHFLCMQLFYDYLCYNSE